MMLQVTVAQNWGGGGVLGSIFDTLTLKVFKLLSQEERSSRHCLDLFRKICAGDLYLESLLESMRMNEVIQEHM